MKRLISILLLVAGITLSGQTSGITPVDKQINNMLFAGRWEQSKSLIDQQIKKFPDHPKYYFIKAYMYYMARFFSNTAPDRDSTINIVHYWSSRAIETGKKLQASKEVNFYLGCAYAYIARAHAMRQEYWSAYWNAGDAENYLEDVIEEDPEYYDAYFDLGVFEYFPDAVITGFTSVLAWVGGMSGDREKGLEYMRLVSDKGSLFKSEADLALGVIYNFFENDQQTGLEYYDRVLQLHPENNFADNQKQRVVFFQMLDDKGVDYFISNFDSLKVKYEINNAAYLNTIGYNLMGQERYDEALKIFQLNLELYPEVANCYDSLAECFMNRNENEQAIKYYRIANEKLETDTTATEDFKQRLRAGIQDRLEELQARISS